MRKQTEVIMSTARAYRSRSCVSGRWQRLCTDGEMAFGRITTHSVLICEQQEHGACGCRCWEVNGGACGSLLGSILKSGFSQWIRNGEQNWESGTGDLERKIRKWDRTKPREMQDSCHESFRAVAEIAWDEFTGSVLPSELSSLPYLCSL